MVLETNVLPIELFSFVFQKVEKDFLEVKNRLWLLHTTFISTFFLNFYYKETLLFIVMQSNLITFFHVDINFSYFIFTNVTEILSIYLRLIVFVTFQFFSLYFYFHIFFIANSALFYLECFYIKYYFKLFFSLWFTFSVLIFYLIIPLTWNFLLSFQQLIIASSFRLHFETKLVEYFFFHINVYSRCITYTKFLTFIVFILQSTNFWMLEKYRKFYHLIFLFSIICFYFSEFFVQFITYSFLILIYELFILNIIIKKLSRAKH